MNTGKYSRNFWIGNGILAVAMLTLFFMGPLSDALGIWAAVLWMVLAAVGMARCRTPRLTPCTSPRRL